MRCNTKMITTTDNNYEPEYLCGQMRTPQSKLLIDNEREIPRVDLPRGDIESNSIFGLDRDNI